MLPSLVEMYQKCAVDVAFIASPTYTCNDAFQFFMSLDDTYSTYACISNWLIPAACTCMEILDGDYQTEDTFLTRTKCTTAKNSIIERHCTAHSFPVPFSCLSTLRLVHQQHCRCEGKKGLLPNTSFLSSIFLKTALLHL